MAALMKIPGTFVFTHDSIGLGEDGPTHQPVEQTATLRLMPQMSVWRPCDAVETAVAWKMSLERQNGPTSIVLTRQGLEPQERSAERVGLIEKGGYILADCDGEPEVIVIATGSEVQLAIAARTELQGEVGVRVVSMPSTDVFDAQPESYRESVLPKEVRTRLVVEAGISDGWYKYAGLDGRILGMTTFGESGPGAEVFAHFGFTPSNVVDAIKAMV